MRWLRMSEQRATGTVERGKPHEKARHLFAEHLVPKGTCRTKDVETFHHGTDRPEALLPADYRFDPPDDL